MFFWASPRNGCGHHLIVDPVFASVLLVATRDFVPNSVEKANERTFIGSSRSCWLTNPHRNQTSSCGKTMQLQSASRNCLMRYGPSFRLSISTPWSTPTILQEWCY